MRAATFPRATHDPYMTAPNLNWIANHNPGITSDALRDLCIPWKVSSP